MHCELIELLTNLLLECPHVRLYLGSLVISLPMWVIKKLNCDFQIAKEKRLLKMNELEELKNESYDNVRIYKDKTKKWHDQKIMRREFKAGELVLPYNSKLKLFLGKLKSRWSDPYTVVASTPFGAVTLETNSGNEFKVNGQRLKLYLGGNINED